MEANVALTKRAKSVRDYFGMEEAVYIMDAKHTGNIGRFLNVRVCVRVCVSVRLSVCIYLVVYGRGVISWYPVSVSLI